MDRTNEKKRLHYDGHPTTETRYTISETMETERIMPLCGSAPPIVLPLGRQDRERSGST